jgi:hypothetical protein
LREVVGLPVLAEATGGMYSGLVRLGAGQAYLRVQINRAGTLTGVLFVEGQRVNLSAVDDGSGTFSFDSLGEVIDLDDPTQMLELALEIQRDTDGSRMAGTLEAGELSSEFTLRRKPAENDAAGAYSLILPVPSFDARRPLTLGGHGYARMLVAPNGHVRVAGELASGRAFAVGAYVQGKKAASSEPGTAPGVSVEILALLDPRGPGGTFGGTLRFVAGDKNADLRGNFLWRFAGREKPGGFRPGLRLYQPVLGSIFQSLDPSDLAVFTPDRGPQNVRVKISGYGIPEPETDVGNATRRELTAKFCNFQAEVDNDTGLIRGTCRHPASGRIVRARGTVYQKTNEVFGLFPFGPGSSALQIFGK